MPEAIGPRWLRWFHRIGYVATPAILLLLRMIGITFAQERLARGAAATASRQHATLMLHHRVFHTPLSTTGHTDDFVAAALDRLTPLSGLGADGLRFVATPADGRGRVYAFAFAALPDAASASAVLVLTNVHARHAPARFAFSIPIDAYRALAGTVDRLFDGWRSDEPGLCLDGTIIAFERVRGNDVMSTRATAICAIVHSA